MCVWWWLLLRSKYNKFNLIQSNNAPKCLLSAPTHLHTAKKHFYLTLRLFWVIFFLLRRTFFRSFHNAIHDMCFNILELAAMFVFDVPPPNCDRIENIGCSITIIIIITVLNSCLVDHFGDFSSNHSVQYVERIE